MKELSIEQKAKAYDEALKVLHKYDGANIMFTQDLKEEMFPELAESGDERIRKDIIHHIEFECNHSIIPHQRAKQWIAWLEKQVQVCLSHDDEIMIRQLTEYFTTGKGLQNTNNTVVEWLADVKRKLEKQGEQKPVGFNIGDEITVNGQVCRVVAVDEPTWSKEDEAVLDALIKRLEGEDIHVSPHLAVKCLKSIKDRVQLKQEWSEKDKKLWVHDDDIFLDAAKMIVEDSPRKSYGGVHKKEIVPWFYSLKERLKSLRTQSQWKPTSEQMKFLWKYSEQNNYDGTILSSLYNDLKKLKG